MQNVEQQGSLSEKFQGFGAAPSDALWGNIAAAIDDKKKRRGAFWWWLGSGLAATVVIGILVFNGPYMNQNAVVVVEAENVPANKRIQGEVNYKETSTINNLIDAGTIEESQVEVVNQQPVNQNLEKSNQQIADANNDNIESTNKIQLIESVKLNPTINADYGLVDFMQKPAISLLNVERNEPVIGLLHLDKKIKHRPWEIGFHIAYYNTNLSIVSKKEMAYDPSVQTTSNVNVENFIDGPEDASLFQSLPDATTLGYSSLVPSTQSTVSKNINLGFYAGKYLTNRIMFQTGLGYSRSSYRTIYNNGFSNSPTTHITSLNIPVGFSIDAVQLQRFKLRPSIALNNEFAVYENVKTDMLMTEYLPKNLTSGYSASVELSIGHLFRLRPKLALNVSPSFRYYFLQNIQSQNYLIKENDWIGGKIGLIWTL